VARGMDPHVLARVLEEILSARPLTQAPPSATLN
jgi:hypothetical protein